MHAVPGEKRVSSKFGEADVPKYRYYSKTNNNNVSNALYALLFASDNAFKHKLKNIIKTSLEHVCSIP